MIYKSKRLKYLVKPLLSGFRNPPSGQAGRRLALDGGAGGGAACDALPRPRARPRVAQRGRAHATARARCRRGGEGETPFCSCEHIRTTAQQAACGSNLHEKRSTRDPTPRSPRAHTRPRTTSRVLGLRASTLADGTAWRAFVHTAWQAFAQPNGRSHSRKLRGHCWHRRCGVRRSRRGTLATPRRSETPCGRSLRDYLATESQRG